MATSTSALGEPSVIRVSADGETGAAVFHAATEAAESIPVIEVGPTGANGLSPLVLATHEGETAFVPNCDTDRAQSVVAALEDETLPEDAAVVEHDSDTTTLPMPETGPLGVGSRHALAGAGWSVPTSIADYTESRGALLTEHAADAPDTVHERVEKSGLRGRGRGDASADAPIADEWTTANEAAGDPVVVVNANETDEHAAGDSLLLESAPLTVLDPALAAAHAVDATAVVVYINETETTARERTEEAANALTDELDTDISISVVAGPDEYKAGEPTMALEVLEGNHRIEARRSPPGPNEHGLDGRPTLVHTPRTFAQVGRVLDGDDIGGADGDPGTRLVTVAGDVDAPATVELSTGTTLETALPAVETENGQKAACVGGIFGGLTRSLDVPASAPGLTGAHLGTNGVIELLDDSTCTVALAGERAKFAKEENCGRCVPCREGSKQLVDLLRDVYDGEYKDGMLRELTRVMHETSVCGFGHDASRPVTTAMEEFETEFNAHAKGRCPTGVCDHP